MKPRTIDRELHLYSVPLPGVCYKEVQKAGLFSLREELFVLILVILLGFILIEEAFIFIMEYRSPTKAIAWMFLTFVLPIIGLVAYFFIEKPYKRHAMKSGGKQEEVQVHQEVPIMAESEGNRVVVLSDGNAFYEALLQVINDAEQEILFQFYILRDDRSGRRFLQALTEKAKQGVAVKVTYDGLGSHMLTNSYIKQLQAAGVEVHGFLPLFQSLFARRINYRNHRKNVVIDSKTAFIGGYNIGDEYVGGDPKLGYWRDTHLQITGGIVPYLRSLFYIDWALASSQPFTNEPLKAKNGLAANVESNHHDKIKIIASGPNYEYDAIYESYFRAITSAKERIYIETPYFVPDSALLAALQMAIRSGVEVKIIIPDVSDHALVQLATLSFIEEILRYGARIYQYRRGFMHAKVMLIDQKTAIVGTANFDVRSFYNNFELNAVLVDPATIARLEEDFARDLTGSKEIGLDAFRQRSRFQKAKESAARMISPLL